MQAQGSGVIHGPSNHTWTKQSYSKHASSASPMAASTRRLPKHSDPQFYQGGSTSSRSSTKPRLNVAPVDHERSSDVAFQAEVAIQARNVSCGRSTDVCTAQQQRTSINALASLAVLASQAALIKESTLEFQEAVDAESKAVSHDPDGGWRKQKVLPPHSKQARRETSAVKPPEEGFIVPQKEPQGISLQVPVQEQSSRPAERLKPSSETPRKEETSAERKERYKRRKDSTTVVELQRDDMRVAAGRLRLEIEDGLMQSYDAPLERIKALLSRSFALAPESWPKIRDEMLVPQAADQLSSTKPIMEVSIYCHNLKFAHQVPKGCGEGVPVKLFETAIAISKANSSVACVQELQRPECGELILLVLQHLDPAGRWTMLPQKKNVNVKKKKNKKKKEEDEEEKKKKRRRKGNMKLATFVRASDFAEVTLIEHASLSTTTEIDGDALHPRQPVAVRLTLKGQTIEDLILINVHMKANTSKAVAEAGLKDVLTLASNLRAIYKCDVLLAGDMNLDPFNHRDLITSKGGQAYEGAGATNRKQDAILDAFICMPYSSEGEEFFGHLKLYNVQLQGQTISSDHDPIQLRGGAGGQKSGTASPASQALPTSLAQGDLSGSASSLIGAVAPKPAQAQGPAPGPGHGSDLALPTAQSCAPVPTRALAPSKTADSWSQFKLVPRSSHHNLAIKLAGFNSDQHITIATATATATHTTQSSALTTATTSSTSICATPTALIVTPTPDPIPTPTPTPTPTPDPDPNPNARNAHSTSASVSTTSAAAAASCSTASPVSMPAVGAWVCQTSEDSCQLYGVVMAHVKHQRLSSHERITVPRVLWSTGNSRFKDVSQSELLRCQTLAFSSVPREALGEVQAYIDEHFASLSLGPEVFHGWLALPESFWAIAGLKQPNISPGSQGLLAQPSSSRATPHMALQH